MHVRRAGLRRLLTVVWATCIVTGLVLVGQFGYGMWRGVSEQRHLTQVWKHENPAPRPVAKAVDGTLKRPVDGVDFAIRIPKLDYYAAIREGVDSGVLYSSPGHYPTTRWPGDPGTVGVAAHNVYWINFPQLAKGDEIDLETRYGMYRYRVVSTEIVNPDNRTALVTDANGFHLTLTTCWPLWAGAFATQRYIIHTDQFWPVPVRPGYT
ncbi:MAG TPA: class D sortase [Candidatus Limnocylindrales bacterium]|nr:class D sortase [Candidatus Limnocylindrales bacterium]